MKRLTASFVLIAAATVAFAQAPFTIMRPLEGSTVRETADILLPAGSVPSGTYIGVRVDGKFVEATVPTTDDKRKAQVYKLDTKKLKIADGEHTLRLDLYGNFQGGARMMDSTEVKFRVGNQDGIKVPEDGLKLQYKFVKGLASTYKIEEFEMQSILSEARNRMGGRATEIPVGGETLRMLYAIEDVKPGGNGLIRSQILPNPGKDYAIVTASGDDKPKKYGADTFAPIYRIITPTGREVYADAPVWFGFLGDQGSGSLLDLYALQPLPLLPADKVKPGDRWEAGINLSSGGLERIWQTGKSLSPTRASATFESVEWELGKKCAKISYEITLGERSRETGNLTVLGREFRNDQRNKLMQVIWLSIDEGRIVKSEFTLEADVRVTLGGGGGGGNQGGGGAAAGGGGMASGAPTPLGGGGGAGNRGGGGNRGPEDGGLTLNQSNSGTEVVGGPNNSPGGGGAGSRGGAGGRGQPGGGGGGNAGGGNRGAAYFVRQKLFVRMTLEK